MKHQFLMALVLLGLFVAHGNAKTKAEKQADVRKQVDETMTKLYKAQPSSKQAIKKARGYAAFSNFGMKILLAGGGKGQGLAFDNATQTTTYMKMLEARQDQEWA